MKADTKITFYFLHKTKFKRMAWTEIWALLSFKMFIPVNNFVQFFCPPELVKLEMLTSHFVLFGLLINQWLLV